MDGDVAIEYIPADRLAAREILSTLSLRDSVSSTEQDGESGLTAVPWFVCSMRPSQPGVLRASPRAYPTLDFRKSNADTRHGP